ncbi:RteC domain-containing protein [Hymenobacter sp. DH14]|uniref:RteC domain-containing protein n=1 Tax=Hymenobacter cyanobacteriorum TaxID=2926463 RepID=A0A9X1VFL1_9BACT|nr:RteC domain-containing protein [Hymenobacter cyanobacteriorum]MCI1187857.1 RteC domain-containing protein [Hymenobacter cyanobacteriorum]
MLSFPAEREFINQLCGVQGTCSGRFDKLALIKLAHRSYAAGENFEESVAEFILKLPLPNQIQTLDFILNKLVGEDGAVFLSIPWWVGEVKGYRSRLSYWKDEVIAYAGFLTEDFNKIYREIAAAIANGESVEKMADWTEAINILGDVLPYTHEDLTLLSQTQIDDLSHELDYDVFSIVAQEIAFKEYDRIVLQLSQFYSSVLSGDHKPNQTAHLKWMDGIQDFCHEISLYCSLNETEGSIHVFAGTGFKIFNESFVQFLKLIKDVGKFRRDQVYEWLNPSPTDIGVKDKVLSPVLAWQGSKTDLAELGYALLEAGLIGGPREAALKSLANFFGQELGNPAKHLQTLQKRQWDPGKKEPVTPLLDRMASALKSLLRIKAIAPAKK